MKDYGISTYGDRIADVYDEWYSDHDPADAVETLAELAGRGPVLELAIGTGRVAVPLAERGLEVHGIDASEAMVGGLRAKPGGAGIPVTIGDFADVGVDGRYSLIFVVFNTFFGLTTQERQVRCFENVAARLGDGGVFVIEAFVPDHARFDRDQRVGVWRVEADRVLLEASRHDAAAQTVETQQIELGRGAPELVPIHIRYAWPSELDLMARLAGLRLLHRWADWRRSDFDGRSGGHVSVYGGS